jgi:heme/copper-type cytochrome/quinol oxidase subunit 2
VVPVDTPITLDISSTDVLHSWSVPALAPTAEAVPGIQGEVNFTATETGTFEGRATRFSGPGYPTMRTRVIVVEPDEYEAFVKERIDGIKQARAAVQDRVQSGTAPGVRFQTK